MASNTEKSPINQEQLQGIHRLTETIVKMFEVYFKLFKLEAKSSLTNIFAVVIISSFALILLSVFLLFVSIGMAFLIAHTSGSPMYVGFFSMALFYLLIILLVYWKRKWIWTQLYVFLDKFDSDLST